MRTIDLRGLQPTAQDFRDLVPRPELDIAAAGAAAGALIDEVRSAGARALADQAERFDGVRPEKFRVPADEIGRAVDSLEPAVRAALEESIVRVRKATSVQVPAPASTVLGDGAVVEQRWQPVERAGLYVPGGKAPLASSVIMNAVPAQVAGVPSIALASPPQKDFGGTVHPTILGAAGLLGVEEVYAIGGAGAIGALAYGVDEIGLRPVRVITGPGNIYVAAAKRAVRGVVGIDSEAGPTEILVIADDTAHPELVAADLLSQAEHDEQAASLLVTTSAALAARVQEALQRRLDATRHRDRAGTALAGRQSAIVVVDDLAAAAAFSNAYAPEHLELHAEDNEALLRLITTAGAIFVGENSPVSLGDYLAGSNHVLPTGGQAHFAAGLGAYAFLRPQQVIRYGADALGAVADRIAALADAENLPAHGEAVRAREPARAPSVR